MALPILPEFGGRCRKAMLGVWECPFNGATLYGRVWRKGSGKQCSECGSAPLMAIPILLEFGGRCRKAMLGVLECPFKGNPLRQSLEEECLKAMLGVWEFGGRVPESSVGVWECPFNGATLYSRVWRKGAGKRGFGRASQFVR